MVYFWGCNRIRGCQRLLVAETQNTSRSTSTSLGIVCAGAFCDLAFLEISALIKSLWPVCSHVHVRICVYIHLCIILCLCWCICVCAFVCLCARACVILGFGVSGDLDFDRIALARLTVFNHTGPCRK